jgi:hypothetical protein
MKQVIIIPGLLLLLSLSCRQDSQPGTRQGYQTRSDRLGGASNQTSAAADEQTATDGRTIYIVAGTAKTEMAAIQAAQKFQNFGFESNVFRAPNGAYIITVGATRDQTLAEQLLRENIKQGKLSERSALSFGENWVGPIYAPTQSTWQSGANQTATTQPAETGTQNIYIPSSSTNNQSGGYAQPTEIPGPQASQNVDAFASGATAFYVVISQAGNENQALTIAQQYIRQGLTVFVFETTAGYAVTLSRAVSKMDAEAIRAQAANKISAIKIVPAGPEWKRQIFP